MSVHYQAVIWNRQKKIYDAVVASFTLAYVGLFVVVGYLSDPAITIETLVIRAFGTAALLLLHVILCIGPLCRLDRRFLPILYNRRHLGVTMFLLAAVHGVFSIVQFHALGNVNPIASVLTSNTRFDSLPQFPFQVLGLTALAILFLMAATSHDFWLHMLSPPVWKRLHMMVYLAYGMLLAHVLLGAVQSDRSPVLPILLGIGATVVVCLHLTAARKEYRKDRERRKLESDGYANVGQALSIPENGACTVALQGERVAIFRYDGKVSAVSNVCRHQNGPLGEGRIIDGCITCPWHGYQYRPESGSSPPPFNDKVSTYRTKVVDGVVYVHPEAFAPGTFVEPSVISLSKGAVSK